MPTNLELKAIVESPRRVNAVLKQKTRRQGLLRQTDTYFVVRKGRLKVREFHSGESELIYYMRHEGKGDRWSNYEVIDLKDGSRLKTILSKLFRIRVVVRKKRQLYLYKNARIHIDAVEGLGRFIEFEVIVNSGKRQARGVYNELRKLFGIEEASLIKYSYADLMERSINSRRRRAGYSRKGLKQG